jgi:3'-phosphoadenosine 5'-phosphosulfate sulfotransferase (PAPS reductase)/FAD synthetase
MKHTKRDLLQFQALPLSAKIRMTANRVEGWYEYWNSYRADRKDNDPDGIYLSFSGGKDSTVLRHLIKTHCIAVYDCPSVFVDTGLEYPEIRTFALEHADVVLRPAMPFNKVIECYGYPVIGKAQARGIRDLQNAHGQNDATVNLRLTGYNRKGVYCSTQKLGDKWHHLKDAPFKISEQCCDVMKKKPFFKYVKENRRAPVTAVMCDESNARTRAWFQTGCNAFDAKNPASQPMAFWTEQDVLEYLLTENVPYSPIYGDIKRDDAGQLYTTGERRTGCMFCAFGAHLEKYPNRFERMRLTHPKQYDYCMRSTDEGGLGMAAVLEYIGIKF